MTWLALAAGTQPAMAAKKCKGATLTPGAENLDRVRNATLCLVNAERTKRNRKPLRANRRLGRSAQAYSRQMVLDRFFAHVCPRGTTLNTRARAARYLNRSVRDYALGENLGWGSGTLSTPKSIVRAWMRSSKHRKAILTRRFRDAGVGIAPGAPAAVNGIAATYTMEFGYRRTRG